MSVRVSWHSQDLYSLDGEFNPPSHRRAHLRLTPHPYRSLPRKKAKHLIARDRTFNRTAVTDKTL